MDTLTGKQTPLNEEESLWVSVMRLNKAEKKIEVTKVFKLGRLRAKYHWSSSKNLWGRFGGGWNWELGIQIGSTTVILNCLIFSLRFWIEKKAQAEGGR